MKNISFSIDLTDDLKPRMISVINNDTGLPSDSQLILCVCEIIVKDMNSHQDDFMIQDLLNELKIKIQD